MQVFSDIRRAPIDEVEETEITVYNNFANFPQALLVMIRYVHACMYSVYRISRVISRIGVYISRTLF